MAIFADLIKGALGPITDFVGGLVHSGEEKAEHQLKLEHLKSDLAIKIEEVMIVEMNAKKSIIIAEMQQGDLFTKRARPSIIYGGILMAMLETGLNAAAYFQGFEPPGSFVPGQFWLAWTGIAGSWVIGRSAEKRGMQNKLISAITGNGRT